MCQIFNIVKEESNPNQIKLHQFWVTEEKDEDWQEKVTLIAASKRF
jgi:hypothetical protein